MNIDDLKVILFKNKILNFKESEVKRLTNANEDFELIQNRIKYITLLYFDMFSSNTGGEAKFKVELVNGRNETVYYNLYHFVDYMNTRMTGEAILKNGTYWYDVESFKDGIVKKRGYLYVDEKCNNSIDIIENEQEKKKQKEEFKKKGLIPGNVYYLDYKELMYIGPAYSGTVKKYSTELTKPKPVEVFVERNGDLIVKSKQVASKSVDSTEPVENFKISFETMYEILISKNHMSYFKFLLSGSSSMTSESFILAKQLMGFPKNKKEYESESRETNQIDRWWISSLTECKKLWN